MPQQKRATTSSQNNEMQGEGNYTAAKEYDEATQAFIKSGKVKDAAKNAAPKNANEAREMLEAEEKGRAHAKPDLKQARVKEPNTGTDNTGAGRPAQSKTGKPTVKGR